MHWPRSASPRSTRRSTARSSGAPSSPPARRDTCRRFTLFAGEQSRAIHVQPGIDEAIDNDRGGWQEVVDEDNQVVVHQRRSRNNEPFSTLLKRRIRKLLGQGRWVH